MTTIHERLKEIRTHFGLSIREFAKEIHFSYSLYGAVEIGNREPNPRIIDLIVARFGINKDWLITGKGKMLASESTDYRLNKIIEIYNQVSDPLKESILEMSKVLVKLHKK
jgi:transcriptional regulator with XRE-family HTH domain